MTTTTPPVPFHRRAKDVFSQLEPEERVEVEKALAGWGNIPWSHWPHQAMRRVAPDSGHFVLAAGPGLLLILQPPEGDGPPTVLDIVRREALAAFARS